MEMRIVVGLEIAPTKSEQVPAVPEPATEAVPNEFEGLPPALKTSYDPHNEDEIPLEEEE